ncbi:hypothetical protein SVIOM74S_08117 [Streptomyces violarus]
MPSAPTASAASTISSEPVSTLKPVMPWWALAPVTTWRKAARSPLESLSAARTPSVASSRTTSAGSFVWTATGMS